MDAEASSFETSEILGTFLTSTPLLKEAWRLCSTANATGCGAFVVEQVGGVGYVAFSGVQELPVLGWDPNYGMLVSLDAAGHGLFPPLKYRYDGEEPVMVHSGVLRLFLHHHSRPDFQDQRIYSLPWTSPYPKPSPSTLIPKPNL
ncbi:lipase-like PAD4 isoform X2 [Eucalyptus grandis]|uniref:lipase-like PAD4 isoform X2 n=1 Tax=Eucalyptus grandis TaxID=71139 RepID=UPI00192EAD95|nr:lipase-like PAD4 isoform X2 [Eucalyptus grandis]